MALRHRTLGVLQSFVELLETVQRTDILTAVDLGEVDGLILFQTARRAHVGFVFLDDVNLRAEVLLERFLLVLDLDKLQLDVLFALDQVVFDLLLHHLLTSVLVVGLELKVAYQDLLRLVPLTRLLLS